MGWRGSRSVGLGLAGVGFLVLGCSAGEESRSRIQGTTGSPAAADPSPEVGLDGPAPEQTFREPVPQTFQDWCEEPQQGLIAATLAEVLASLELGSDGCASVEDRLLEREGRLILAGTRLSDLRPVAALRHLRELVVEGDGSARTLFGLASLRRLPGLEVLRLVAMDIRDIDLEFLLQPWVDSKGTVFRALPELRILDLSHNRIRRLDYAWPPDLGELHLGHNRIGNLDERQADRVWSNLGTLEGLRLLDLRGNPFGHLFRAQEDRVAHERLLEVLRHATERNRCLSVQYTRIRTAEEAALPPESQTLTLPDPPLPPCPTPTRAP